MTSGSGGETRAWEALARNHSARGEGAYARAPRSTPLGSGAKLSVTDIFSANATNKLQKACKTSRWAAVYGLRGGSIRKKIIGRRMCPVAAGTAGGRHIRRSAGSVHAAAGAGVPAWRRRFPPSLDRPARRSPGEDWLREPDATIQSSAKKSSKPREGTPKAAESSESYGPPEGGRFYINLYVIYIDKTL
jgi:hypothetical protein